jgi:hypothetical protein
MHRARHRSRKIFKKTSEKSAFYRGKFPAFLRLPRNPLKRKASSIARPLQEVKCSPRFDFPQRHSGDLSMTITAAHISPIMSVIAGVLILMMPRLLNLVVAIFLILNGLIGFGALRWLHM